MRRARSGRQAVGSASVEFALVVMPFCLLLMGMIDYGWYFFVTLACTNAVRTGARVATTYPGAVSACLTAATAQGQTATQNALTSVMPALAAYTPSASCTCALQGTPSSPQYTCSIVGSFVPLTGDTLVPLPAKIQTSATMR
jgi:Flp pilus assembly protein TadG